MENEWNTVKKVDIVGKPNFEKKSGTLINTPHVHEGNPEIVRPAKSNELPKQ